MVYLPTENMARTWRVPGDVLMRLQKVISKSTVFIVTSFRPDLFDSSFNVDQNQRWTLPAPAKDAISIHRLTKTIHTNYKCHKQWGRGEELAAAEHETHFKTSMQRWDGASSKSREARISATGSSEDSIDRVCVTSCRVKNSTEGTPTWTACPWEAEGKVFENLPDVTDHTHTPIPLGERRLRVRRLDGRNWVSCRWSSRPSSLWVKNERDAAICSLPQTN